MTQNAEATQFLYRVRDTHPHLLVLGYQKIIDGTVEGMKALGIANSELTQAEFWAGLNHAMDKGILPKPPAPAPPKPTPEELATKAEQERLIEKAKRVEEEERKFAAQNYKSGKFNHAHPPKQEESTAMDGVKKSIQAHQEARAKAEAEAMVIYGNRGIDHRATEELRKIFAHDKNTGEIRWGETWALRRVAQNNYAKAKQNKLLV